MKITSSISSWLYGASIFLALLSIRAATAQALTVSVSPKEEETLSYEIKISNQTDENIKIRGVTTRTGTLAPFKATDTYISPFMEGTVFESSAPYLEVEVRYAAAPPSNFNLTVGSSGPVPQKAEPGIFVFLPKQTFTFTRLLREPPMEVQVCYFDGDRPNEKTTVLWRK